MSGRGGGRVTELRESPARAQSTAHLEVRVVHVLKDQTRRLARGIAHDVEQPNDVRAAREVLKDLDLTLDLRRREGESASARGARGSADTGSVSARLRSSANDAPSSSSRDSRP